MNYGPFSSLYIPCNVQTDVLATTEALCAVLGPTEAIWLHSHGVKMFRIDLSGVVDNEKRVNKYLKMRSLK